MAAMFGRCCAIPGLAPGNGEKAFEKGGVNDLSGGVVQKRRCTDMLCIPLFALAQLVFIVVTLVGVRSGDPTLLYRPRDFSGGYCGVKKNWNSGPNTERMPVQTWTMNLTAMLEPSMKQALCSSVARRVLVDGDGGAAPLLPSAAERQRYLCHCCLIPCSACQGSLRVGGDLDTPSKLKSTVLKRLSEFTDHDKVANLYDPAGLNGQWLSSTAFWRDATSQLQRVCVPDCDVDFNTLVNYSAPRRYNFAPDADTVWHDVWARVMNASESPGLGSATLSLLEVLNTSFSFQALPTSLCPYRAERCVPMPGMQFALLAPGSGRCTFQPAAAVVDVLGGGMAEAMSSLGVSAASDAAQEEFGTLVGSFQATLDSFVCAAFASFVIGLVFLVLLRFFIGFCVWFAILGTIVAFALCGACFFVISGQCKGAGFLQTGSANTAAVVAAGRNTAERLQRGELPVDESMTGDGANYRGVQMRSKSGRECMAWDTQDVLPMYNSTNFPGGDLRKNYCRNPYNKTDPYKGGTIWCIVGGADVAWEECAPVGLIQPECRDGYQVESATSRKLLQGMGITMWVIGGLFLIAVRCFARRIFLAIALTRTAARFLGQNPQVLLIPVVQGVVGVLWIITWVLSASFLLSQVPSGYTPSGHFATFAEAFGTRSSCAMWESGDQCTAGVPGVCRDKWPMGSVWKDTECATGADGSRMCWRCAPPRYVLDLRFAASFFVFLWNNAFLVALGQILLAMTVGIWFFSEKKVFSPVLQRSVRTVFRKHLGSVMYGSFIIAVVKFIRYSLQYLQKQAQANQNRIVVCVLRVVGCLIWCLEKFIEFVNRNAYIQIALQGRPFCQSARTAFDLILRNAIRFGIVVTLSFIVQAIGFLFIMIATVFAGHLIVVRMHPDQSPLIPDVSYLFVGYLMAKLYMGVFGMAIDTSLHCFIACEEMGEGGDHVPAELRSLVDAVGTSASMRGPAAMASDAKAASVVGAQSTTGVMPSMSYRATAKE